MNTKFQIIDKFIEIGNEEGFDNANINRIIKELGISRTSFYYHFKDIPDVINYYIYEKMAMVRNECSKFRNMEKGMQYSIKNFLYNFPEYRKMLDSKWRKDTEKIMFEVWQDHIQAMFSKNHNEILVTTAEKKFFVDFMAGGICYYFANGDFDAFTPEFFSEQLFLLAKSRHDTMNNRGK